MSYSICKGTDCPMKESCLRFLATGSNEPNNIRHFMDYPPFVFDGVFSCDSYDEIRLTKKDVPEYIENLKKLFNL